MKRTALAARLIAERRGIQRKKLLAENRHIADVRLARELKDACYRVWASAPTGARSAAAALKSLALFSPSPEIKAIHFWIEGIADITSGKLESAIVNLDAASNALARLSLKHESAQPQVAKLIALAMLGRYEDTRTAGRKALKIFEKFDDQLAAGKIEMNLSNIVSRRDEYRRAEQYCLSAYKRFEKLGETEWQTMAENGLANTYAELNDFKRAEKFYDRALERARSAGMHVTVAEIEASMGTLALFRGRYADALRSFELSRQKYEKLGMPHQTAISELEIADIYAELNLNAEATELYQRLIPALHRLKMRAEEARARTNFGRLLIAVGDLRAARAELKRASALFNAEKNSIAAAAVDLRRASLAAVQLQYAEALAIVHSASVTLEASENVRLRLSAMWLRGHILARLKRYEDAEKLLERTLKETAASEQPALAQSAMNSLGEIASWKGNARRAEKHFEAAIRSAEAARAPLPGEEFRMAFLAKTLEPYENLMRLYIAEGKIEKAFVCVERSRARALLEGVAAKGRGTRPAETTIREELNWYYSRLDRADPEETARLQKEIRSREKQLASLGLRTLSIANGKEPINKTGELDLSKLQKKLGSKTALVEFVVDSGVYSAFVVTGDKVDYAAELATETEVLSILEGLHFQFRSLRFGGEALRPFAAQLKSRSDAYLEKLYAALIRPLERFLAGRDLAIVPSGALNYVPFHALFDGKDYLVQSREMVCAPSAAIWLLLNSRRPSKRANALLMAFADEKIPLVDREIKGIAKTLANPTSFIGKRATFSAFEANAPAFDIIHLACHGQFRPDNPMFSSLHLADGWVTVRDVCSQTLKASLVTLSACETGLSRISAGEEILGLARGFLTAGAGALVLSLWTVSDEATERLMSDFYRSLQRGLGVSASLRIAQSRFIDCDEHPYFWSPFFAIA